MHRHAVVAVMAEVDLLESHDVLERDQVGVKFGIDDEEAVDLIEVMTSWPRRRLFAIFAT